MGQIDASTVFSQKANRLLEQLQSSLVSFDLGQASEESLNGIIREARELEELARIQAGLKPDQLGDSSIQLGHLINLVGELVITSAAMKMLIERHGIDAMSEVVTRVEHLVEELRDNALQLRMMPIGELFTRCRRVVEESGKDIELIISGEETEIDKTVAEKIRAPLDQLLRYAVERAIELPEQQVAADKPTTGRVHLNAFHDAGHLVIEVTDNGASRSQGLALAKVDSTDPSGRENGMDTVRRQIEALRGRVEWDSKGSEGTRATIVLPLTHAIIDGFLVGSAGEHYVIPLAQVVECVEMDENEQITGQGHHYVNLRGEVLPYLRLREFFEIGEEDGEQESLVVVRLGHTKAGLVVNELLGELQTVIKPLGKVFEQLEGVAGATVLGSGEIALILDVQALTQVAHHRAGFTGDLLKQA